MKISRKLLFAFSVFTIVVFSVIGLLVIVYLQGQSLTLVFAGQAQLSSQIVYGSVYGLMASIGAILLTGLPSFTQVTRHFRNIFANANLQFIDVVFASICAGVGEEILFRGAIQPYLGIWITAIVFVAIHGYLNWKNKPLFKYGVFMVLLSAGFGYLTQLVGLNAAIIAHALFDICMFSYLLYGK